ncbi:uncharacterized protein LOC144021374 isoform X2 [Festucalex cinctus]
MRPTLGIWTALTLHNKKVEIPSSLWSRMWSQSYAIVGHLIKDLLLDITDCLLGPVDEDVKKDGVTEGVCPLQMPPSLSHSHPNAFHVWDQDDVIIPMTPSPEAPTTSPLMAVIPYIPSFFPTNFTSGSPSYNQPIPKESDA